MFDSAITLQKGEKKKLGFYALILMFTVALFASGADMTRFMLKYNPGVDFYLYWGAGVAPQMDKGLTSPYTQIPQYTEVLDNYVKKNEMDSRLSVANRENHSLYALGLDIPGTPLAYASFSIFPHSYKTAYLLFTWAKLVMFVIGMMLLALRQKQKSNVLMPFALMVAGTYAPLAADIRWGNVGTILFFILVISTRMLEKIGKQRSPLFEKAYPSLLTFALLFKPLVLPAVVSLLASFYALKGFKRSFFPTVGAILFLAVLIAVPCLYYNTWSVWTDWLRYLSDVGGKGYYPFANGNASTTIFLAETQGIPPAVSACVILGILLSQAFLVLFAKGNVGRSIIFCLKDPFLCVSTGIVLTFATFPLLWIHYYVLLLIPIFWLLARRPSFGGADYAALLALFLSSGILSATFPSLELTPGWLVLASSWLPLWIGILIAVTEKLESRIVLLLLASKNRLSASDR